VLYFVYIHNQGQFVDSYDPTIENTFNKNIKLKGQEYEVLVVDTAGQDEYSIFPTQYSVDIDGFILVYSIDSEKSFEVVQARKSSLNGSVSSFCNDINVVKIF
jgi:GTPase SAR1 family protein